MSRTRNDMIEWALGEISKTSDEGISISLLFERLESAFSKEAEAKDLVWQGLVAREDIFLGDAKAGLALRKLALEDVLALGLGSKTVNLQPSPEDEKSTNIRGDIDNGQAPVIMSVIPDQSNPNDIITPDPKNGPPPPKESSSQVLESISTPASTQTLKRGRGRPRKNRPQPSTPVAQQISQPPKRRGRPPNEPGSNKPPFLATNQAGKSGGTTTNLPPINVSEKDQNGHIKSSAIENLTTSNAHYSNNPTNILPALKLQRITPHSTDGLEYTTTQKTPRSTRLRPKRSTHLKNAVFTSWEEMQREAGVAGVYIDHNMSHRRRAENIFYGAKSIVLVFKLDELKILQWLETHKNSWIEPLAARVAQTVIQKEDTAQIIPSQREVAGADLQPNERVMGPNSNRQYRPKSTIPGADISPTATPFAGDEGETPRKRKRAPSTSQTFTLADGAASRKKTRNRKSSITLVDHGPKHAPRMPQVQQAQGATPVHNQIPGNKIPDTLTSQTYTLSNQSYDTKDSSHQPPNAALHLRGPIQFSTLQNQHQHAPYQSILENVPFWDGPSQNSAYRSPYASSVGQPTPLDAQQRTESRNAQAYQSPNNQDTVNVGQSPVHLGSDIQPSTAQENYVKNITPQVPKGAIQKRMGDEDGPQKGSFPKSTLSSREELSQFFNPSLTSLNKLRQLDSIIKPYSQNGLSLTHSVKPLDISKSPAKAETNTPRNAIEAALLQATSVPIPNHILRLAATYKGAAGNLLLSSDKSILEFFGLGQYPPQAPIVSLPISRMVSNPITSVRGSYPMEVQISSSKNGVASTHCFQFASSPEAYEAASDIRAKLVTAKIALQFRTGEPYPSAAESEQDKTRPYKCSKCSNRFKNKGGLEYHLTRSQTTCNPNYDHSQAKPRTPRVKKRQAKTIQSLISTISEDKQSPSKQRALQQAQPELSKEKEETHDISSDSEDSILEWAEQHATPGLAPVYQQPSMLPSAPVFSKYIRPLRALPGEGSLWQEILRDVLPDESIAGLPPPDVANEWYFRNIILDLVTENEGLFPGDRGLWFGIVGAWLKRDDKSSKNIPDSKVCHTAFEELVRDGKLRVFSFTFRDKASRIITRNIIAAPGFDPQSPPFQLLRMAIKETYPEFYVPARNAPPDAILSRLQSIARRLFSAKNNQVGARGVDRKAPVPQQTLSSSNDEIITEEALLELEDSSEEDRANDEDDDEFKPWLTDNKRNQRNRQSRPARAIGKRWETSRAFRISSPIKGARAVTQSRGRLATEQGLACNTSIGLYGWSLPTARFPNPETGAWDQDSTFLKQRGSPNYRTRLPEPITYIQASNGAWAERAFGHGVNPIFSRRPRRVEKLSISGNQYRRKIDKGFRPVVYHRKDEHHLLAVPSKDSLSSSMARSQSENFSLDMEGYIEPDEAEYEPSAFEEDKYWDSPSPKIRTPRSTSRSARARSSRTSRLASTRRKSSLIDDEFDLAPFELPHPSQLSRRTRASDKAAEALDEIEMLGTFEPKEIGVGASINYGLRTLPISFGLRSYVFQAEKLQASENFPSYQHTHFLEPKVISQSSDFGEGSWTYYGEQPSAKVQLKWRDNTAFTVENLPYDELDTEDESTGLLRRPRAQDQKKRRIEPRSVSLSSIGIRGDKFSKTRTQTALPADFEGVLLDTAMHPTSTFEIDVAKSPVEFHRGQARQMPNNMTPELERRFVAAVIAVQILTGGLEGNIDWVLIANIFSDFSIQFLMKTWGQLRTKMPDVVEHIAEDFRDAFPGAYKRGEVPPINFDNLTSYNWNLLLDWVTATINPTLNAQSVALPATRKELNKKYLVTENIGEVNNWRESYFGLLTAIYKRIDMAAAVATTVPVRRLGGARNTDGIEINDFTLAKSWVRAAAITPEESWDQKIAGAKLRELGLPLVEDALQALLEAKVLIHRSRGRALPGRSYEASDAFAAPLRKHITNQQFIDALNFKRSLDNEFSSGEGSSVTVDYMANDGVLMCITSLQAHDRIELRGVDVPMNKFGLTGGGYETKKIPREKLRFRIDIHPTSSYVFSHDVELFRRIENVEPPQASLKGELPVWIGITGEPIEDLWKRVLASISQVTALRAGITLDGLKKAFAPTLEEWELKRFMEWGEKLGILERLHKKVEGWIAAEWWWLAVARFCEK